MNNCRQLKQEYGAVNIHNDFVCKFLTLVIISIDLQSRRL